MASGPDDRAPRADQPRADQQRPDLQPGLLQPGDLLAGRYRLDRVVPSGLADGSPADLWLATDEVLERPVAAKVLPVDGARPFLEAAGAAGALAHPVLARVYDADVDADLDVAYVISEWVDGPDLVEALGEDGPWRYEPAVVLAERLADALELAHTEGLLHGRLHPGNVLLTDDGGVKLTDLAVAAALPGRTPVTVGSDDARDLAALLYAALTARWPHEVTPQPAAGLPAAPAGRDSGDGPRLTSPAQVRAGVPRALDGLVMRALDPQRAASAPSLTSAGGLATALAAAVPVEPSGVPPGARPPRVAPRVRRWLPIAVVLAVLVALGGTFLALSAREGPADRSPGQLEGQASPAPGEPAAPAQPIDLSAATVTDFDPPPGDAEEQPGAVVNAYDGDLATVWETERYGSAAFGGLKPGVGLLVDLGAPTPLGAVGVALTSPGTVVELRVADVASGALAGYGAVATGTSTADGLVLTPPPGTTARYALLWITTLSPVDGRFAAGIAEMSFSRP